MATNTSDSLDHTPSYGCRTDPVIGIDLGMSKCCVAVFSNGHVKIIENERGNRTTPSYVAFNNSGRLIGEEAFEQATFNLKNTVYGVKRIIGRRSDDYILLEDQKRWPFQLDLSDIYPRVKVDYNGKTEFINAEQITAMLLTKMKLVAERYLKCSVNSAVISVPSNFNNAQRAATIAAAEIAGLSIISLINEPTAAAVAYVHNKQNFSQYIHNEEIFIFDFGGSKMNASVVAIDDTSINVRYALGSNLGGCDFDRCLLLKYLEDNSMHLHRINTNKMDRITEKIRYECQKAKHSLSMLKRCVLQIEYDYEGSNWHVDNVMYEEQRSRYNYDSNFKSFLAKISEFMRKRHRLPENKIKIVMVGGSSRSPFVEEFIKNCFPESTFDRSLNADEAVAYGAAVHAAALTGDMSVKARTVQDIYSNFIFMKPEKNIVPICCTPKKYGSTFSYNLALKKGPIILYEHCYHAKMMYISYLLHGYQQFSDIIIKNDVKNARLEFAVTRDGILSASLKIDNDTIRLHADHVGIRRMKQIEENYIKDEIEEDKRQKTVHNLESFCYQQKALLAHYDAEMDYIKRKNEQIDATKEWVEYNPNCTLKQCEEMRENLYRYLDIV